MDNSNFVYENDKWKVKTKVFEGSLSDFVSHVMKFDVLQDRELPKVGEYFVDSETMYDTFKDKNGKLFKVPAFSRSFAVSFLDQCQSMVYCSYKDEKEAKKKVQEFSSYVYGNPSVFMR